MLENLNSRILVIDDEEVVRESIRLILTPAATDNSDLSKLAADLFDEPEPVILSSYETIRFSIDEASSGKAGVELVRIALAKGAPYALAFVDMRMPGWDGLEAVQQIRAIDHMVEIVFVTAHSDHSIEEIVHRAGANVGYLRKPFAPEEIKQIATKAVHNWHKVSLLERLVDAHRNARKHYRE